MTFFSSDAFLSSAQQAYFANQQVRPADVEVGGTCYRTLVDRRGRPLSRFPFLDILEPIADCDAPQRASWLGPVETGRVAFDDFQLDDHGHDSVSPFIDWSNVASFDDFMAASRKRSSRAFRQLRKRPAALEKQFDEPVVFRHNDLTAGHLDQCLKWKSAQYLASGYVDVMSRGGETLFRELAAAGKLIVSTLTVGDRLLAAHLGALHQGTFYYWVPAYDSELSKYSPGSLLLEEMMRESFERGDGAFDFLVGAEPYKFFYATDVRLVGDIGQPPLHQRAVTSSRQAAADFIERFPKLQALIRKQIRRVDQFRHR